MIVIPAVDIKAGRCVRLYQGREDRETVYGDDPAAMALKWQREGAEYLHVVDLDGAFSGHPVNFWTIEAIAKAVDMDVQVGGGIRDDDAVDLLLESIGVRRVVVGTRALADLDWVASICKRHPGRIVGGIDARDGRVAVEGWTRDSGVDALQAAQKLAECGVAAIVFTDIATDGMLEGPNVEATRRLAETVGVPVVASGGVSTLDDVRRLSTLPLEGAIIGKALYTGDIDLAEAVRITQEDHA